MKCHLMMIYIKIANLKKSNRLCSFRDTNKETTKANNNSYINSID